MAMKQLYGKLLIFGGAGSLGVELVRYYRDIVDEIVVVSRDEGKHWDLKNKFGTYHKKGVALVNKGRKWNEVELFCTISTLICDVRDSRRVHQVIRDTNPNFIIIAQALKQVDTCESQPSESIDTNILGVRNILDAIEETNVHKAKQFPKVCFVSTDKACNPINVYGMCKSISERMVAAVAKTSKSEYVVTRYGNVISSKGSIIPLFLKQAMEPNFKGFTVTDIRMTRFMMLLEESVKLIDDALCQGKRGEMWIPKIDAFSVKDMADYFSERFNKPVQIIGIRPGEKIHEVLMSKEEVLRAIETNNHYIISDNQPFRNNEEGQEFSSKDYVISKTELANRLDQFLEHGKYVKTV